MLKSLLSCGERAPQVDGNDVVDFRRGGLSERLRDRSTSVIHKNIQCPQLGDRLFDGTRYGIDIPRVRLDSDRATAFSLDVPDNGRGRIGALA
jgi:hypothetical protein